MRATTVLLLFLTACTTNNTTIINPGADTGAAEAGQRDGARAADDATPDDVLVAGGEDAAGDAVSDAPAVEAGQEDASGDALAVADAAQVDVLQTDVYNYTPGSCDPGNDQCLGAPTFPCRGGICPCVPGADPNCRAGEKCCWGLCYPYYFFDGPVPPC